MSLHSKIVDWTTLLTLRDQWREQCKTVVWSNGCFDLMHVGHTRTLNAAKSLGDILVIGINNDDSVRHIKGTSRPLVPDHERAEMIAALQCVDYVIVFEEWTPERCLQRLKPEIHCKGAEYAPPHGKPIPEASLVEEYGGRIEFLPMIPEHSTTRLVEKIRSLPAFAL